MGSPLVTSPAYERIQRHGLHARSFALVTAGIPLMESKSASKVTRTTSSKYGVRIDLCSADWFCLSDILRIPRDGEQSFHGIVNTDSTAT
jgi:hypothetical protein